MSIPLAWGILEILYSPNPVYHKTYYQIKEEHFYAYHCENRRHRRTQGWCLYQERQPYDFLPISFVYPDKFTKGLRAATANVSGEMVDAVGGVKLDDQRDIFYHTYNNAVVIDGIL